MSITNAFNSCEIQKSELIACINNKQKLSPEMLLGKYNLPLDISQYFCDLQQKNHSEAHIVYLLNCIEPGANLNHVATDLLLWLINDRERGVINHAEDSAPLKHNLKRVIAILQLHRSGGSTSSLMKDRLHEKFVAYAQSELRRNKALALTAIHCCSHSLSKALASSAEIVNNRLAQKKLVQLIEQSPKLS